MLFTELESAIPDRLETTEFVLRPIVAADTDLDYAAVMSSREQLRPWEQTGWPADDFTLADDRVDVEMLESRHAARRAFTFTVLDPSESTCLGCVYVMPPDGKSLREAEIRAVGSDRWEDVRAAVYFWVITSRLEDGLEARLLNRLRGWFTEDWDLTPHVFVTNSECAHQLATFESAGLTRRFTVTSSPKAPYLAFA